MLRFFCTSITDRIQANEHTLYLIGRDEQGETCCLRVHSLAYELYVVPENQSLLARLEPPQHPQLFEQLRVSMKEAVPAFQPVRSMAVEPLQRWIDPDSTFFTRETEGTARPLHSVCVRCPANHAATHPSLVVQRQATAVLGGLGRCHLRTTGLSVQETFQIQSGVRGPCWIEVRESHLRRVDSDDQKQTTCVREYQGEARDVRAMPVTRLPMQDPLLTVVVLRYHMQASAGGRTLVPFVGMSTHRVRLPRCLTFDSSKEQPVEMPEMLQRVWSAVYQDGAADDARVDLCTFPPAGLATDALSSAWTVCASETTMLQRMLQRLQADNPDIVLSSGMSRDRLRLWHTHLKTHTGLSAGHVAKFGRFKSATSPFQMVQGRVWCDVLAAAHELLLLRSWRDLARTLREPYDTPQVPEVGECSAWNRLHTDPALQQAPVDLRLRALNTVLDRTAALWRVQMRLLYRTGVDLHLLFLSKQLATLYGCDWHTIFHGSKLGRTASLLAHEFRRVAVHVPDAMLMLHMERDPFGGGARDRSSRLSAVAVVDAEEGADPDDDDTLDADDMEADAGHTTSSSSSSSGTPASGSVKSRGPAQFSGGLNIEPERGVFQVDTDGWAFQVDFRSLYPSIMQELGLCLVNIRQHRAAIADNPPASVGLLHQVKQRLRPVAATGPDELVLPIVQRALVHFRARIKGWARTQTGLLRVLLDTIERAIKLVANTAYGAIGAHAPQFRFRCTSAAALITRVGQSFLMHTMAITRDDPRFAIDRLLQGDTDSLMPLPGVKSLQQTIDLAQALSHAVSEGFAFVRLEPDAIYHSSALWMKKKYAFLKMVDSKNGAIQMGWRGLEIVRTDWCEMAHLVCQWAVEAILVELSSTDGSAASSNERHRSLLARTRVMIDGLPATLAYQARHDLDAFALCEVLDKPLDQYSSQVTESSLHVAVARRMAASHCLLQRKDAVAYVVCAYDRDGRPLEGGGLADRAYPLDVAKALGLQPDLKHYWHTQLHPPLLRIWSVLPPAFCEALKQLTRDFACPPPASSSSSSSDMSD